MKPREGSTVHPQAVQRAGGVLPLPGVSAHFALRVEPAAHARAGRHAGRSGLDPGGAR